MEFCDECDGMVIPKRGSKESVCKICGKIYKLDAKQKKLIWQGTAIGEVDNNPNNRDNGIPKAVGEVFMKYPIGKSIK